MDVKRRAWIYLAPALLTDWLVGLFDLLEHKESFVGRILEVSVGTIK